MKYLITILLLGFFVTSEAQNVNQSQVRQFNAVPAYRVFGRGSGVGSPSFIQLDSNHIPLLHSQGYYDGRYQPLGSGSTTDNASYHTATTLPDSSGFTLNRPNGTKDTIKLAATTPTVAATGDAIGTSSGTGSSLTLPLTLSTVNTNVGTYSNATVTVDAKGRVTAASAGAGGTGAAGSNTQIQVNNAGSLGASANFTEDITSNRFVLSGTPSITSLEGSRVYFNPNHVAQHNNDTLSTSTYGGSFSTGAFTGVKKNAIRILPNGGLFRKDYYTGSVNATLLMGSRNELDGTAHASAGYIFCIRPGAEGGNSMSAGYGVDIGDATTYMRVASTAISLTAATTGVSGNIFWGNGSATSTAVASAFNTFSGSLNGGFQYNNTAGWTFSTKDVSGNKISTYTTSKNLVYEKTSGTPTDYINSAVTVNSTLQGVLPYPRMTTAQRDAMYYVNTVGVITNGGTGYTSTGTTTVAVSGGGSPTTAATVTVSAVSGGAITGIVVTPGANYSTTPTATVSSTAGGTGAVITLSLSPLQEGLTIYNLTTHQTEYWNGTSWVH